MIVKYNIATNSWKETNTDILVSLQYCAIETKINVHADFLK